MLIDLTTVVAPDSPVMQWAKSQSNPHIAMGHVGTHLDCYEKTQIPLENFKSRAILFDVRSVKEEVPLSAIDINRVQEGDFVLFRTGQIDLFEYGSQEYFKDHPQLSQKLIDALLEKKIRFIGIDCAGIRRHAEHEAADRLCEQNGVYVIENLCNLDKVYSDRELICYAAWFDDDLMTGLRCRVIVEQ